MPDPSVPSPDVAAADVAQLQRAADAELIDGYRQAVRFLARVEEVSNINVNDAYDGLASAFARAITAIG
ncbi:hypothetical protein [Streptomyces sp. MH60]|uniref:hypothetical protein n=1 Tax=Streptomyces sp. MH60 TaxID=1940758 RepID=UPI000D48C95E|nr:hypothetical protein [Streptomyces sp. MH60]PPS89522.1 hypothetical protein BZZ08_01668 [Streptomyces sp. MH60]